MRQWYRRAAALLIAAGAISAGAISACKSSPRAVNPQNYFVAEPVKLLLPRAAGWAVDASVKAADANKGGIIMRLVRESAVPGSPRIDVVLDPPRPGSTAVEDFLTRNLQDMAKMEAAGQIHINQVEQRRVAVGTRPAYRVRHEYTIGSGVGQAAINQVSTFVVLDGRGIAITAAGRTELFHPLANSIESIFDGLRLQDDGAQHDGVEPVDLGKVGGKRR